MRKVAVVVALIVGAWFAWNVATFELDEVTADFCSRFVRVAESGNAAGLIGLGSPSGSIGITYTEMLNYVAAGDTFGAADAANDIYRECLAWS